MSESSLALLVAAGLVLIIAIQMTVFMSRLRRVGPHEALVITGRQPGPRIVTNGLTFVWPVLEQEHRLSLEVRTLRLSAGVAVARIPGERDAIVRAAERFLTKRPEELEAILRNVLDPLGGDEHRMREALAPLGFELVSFNRDAVGPG
jgi:uncharacterized membrane protein YqiK